MTKYTFNNFKGFFYIDKNSIYDENKLFFKHLNAPTEFEIKQLQNCKSAEKLYRGKFDLFDCSDSLADLAEWIVDEFSDRDVTEQEVLGFAQVVSAQLQDERLFCATYKITKFGNIYFKGE